MPFEAFMAVAEAGEVVALGPSTLSSRHFSPPCGLTSQIVQLLIVTVIFAKSSQAASD